MLTIFSGCLRNKYSYQNNNEIVTVTPKHKNNFTKFDSIYALEVNQDTKTRGGGISYLSYALKAAVVQTNKVIMKESEKYFAQYSAFVVDDKFYANPTEKAPLSVDTIVFKRTINVKGKPQTAVIMKFVPEKSEDDRFLKFRPVFLQSNYTKVKLKKRDNTLDYEVGILVTASWYDQKYNVQTIGNLKLLLQSIVLGKTYQEKELMGYTTEWFPVIPRTISSEGKIGTGNYSLTINVTESDEFGLRVRHFSETFNEIFIKK